MIITSTTSEIFGVANLSSVLIIDLIIFMLLIGLLIFREFINLYFVHYSLYQPDSKINIRRLIDIAIIPLLYVFIYVLLFRLFHSI